MDNLIKLISEGLTIGVSLESIHDSLLANGESEENIYLAIIGAQLLLKSIDEAVLREQETQAPKTVRVGIKFGNNKFKQ